MSAGSEELERLLREWANADVACRDEEEIADTTEPERNLLYEARDAAYSRLRALFDEREAQVAALREFLLVECLVCGGRGLLYLDNDPQPCSGCGGGGRVPINEDADHLLRGPAATVAREHDARVRAEAIREVTERIKLVANDSALYTDNARYMIGLVRDELAKLLAEGGTT